LLGYSLSVLEVGHKFLWNVTYIHAVSIARTIKKYKMEENAGLHAEKTKTNRLIFGTTRLFGCLFVSYFKNVFHTCIFNHSFIHSIDMCRMQRFFAVLRSFSHSFLLCTCSCHPSPRTIPPSSLTSSYHLFLGLPLNLVVPKFINISLLGILFSSILCTCPNHRNLFNVVVSVIVGF
jgi:hypothetical protein